MTDEIKKCPEILAAERMDWQQFVLNGGPPCFALMDDGHFCGRAKRWAGHGKAHHKFVSLADLLSRFNAEKGGQG